MTATRDAAHLPPMTKLPAARAETTEAFLAKAGPELAALCTACGACFDGVSRWSTTSAFAGPTAKSVTDGLAPACRGEAAPAETIAWVGACAKSGLCVAACPEKDAGLDAMLLVRIAKQRALNDTRQLPAKQDPTLFPRLKIFARLQLSDEELAKWL